MSTLNLRKVDTDSAVPRYIQAKTILAEAIRSGVIPAGAKLPSTSVIGAQINVSLITAHKAIQCLVDEGWLLRERGRGTFVRNDFQESVAARPRYRVALVLHPAIPAGDFYHGALLQGIHFAAERSNIVVEQVIKRSRQQDDLGTVDADGFICFHPYRENFERLEAIAERTSVVVAGGSLERTLLHCVDSQNFEGARQAVRHLVELGHERIAIVNGPLGSTNCLHRFEGYVAELESNGIPVRDEYIFNAASAQGVGAVLDRLAETIKGRGRPTAIFACGYYLVLDVMTLLQQLEISIPQDISLVGFDDPKSASLLNPALTTVLQPVEEIGQRAFERVVQLLDGEVPSPRTLLLPTSLVVRDSTGPAR